MNNIELIAGFSTGKGFSPLSWAIRGVLNTPFSHTYVRKKITIWEAMLDGIRKIPINKWNKENRKIKEFKITITEERWNEILKFIAKHVDKTDYGYLQLVWNLFDRFGIALPMNNKEKRMICSEFMARVFAEELGLDPKTTNFDLLDPQDLYKMFDKITDNIHVERIL